MTKKILSIVILALAVGIVIVNYSKSNSEEKAVIVEEKADITEVQEKDNSISEADTDSNEPLVQDGKTALDFNLTTLEGGAIILSDLKGKKVLLNFWATWCPPCKAEMPHMQNFYEKNKDKDFEILAVNLTQIDNGYEEIEAFVEEYGLTFPIPLDKNGMLATHYQAFTIPTSYFIDREGVISRKVVGPMDEDMMDTFMNEMN